GRRVLRDRRDQASMSGPERAGARTSVPERASARTKMWLFVVPLWAVLALCCYWQPVVRDTWGHYHWHRNYPMTLDLLWRFARDNYLTLNPRLGQVLTWLVTVRPWHPIV